MNNAPVKLARETVKRLLEERPLPENGNEVVASPLWEEHQACFVSIKKDGELRGCIGTLSPLCASLDMEIIANAVSASTRDPRFPPMTSMRELDDVMFSVDVLSVPETVNGIEQLDPKKYGVIVSRGYRRGVLLPDLEGVDTSGQQVQIAAMKAGLYDLEGVTLERFTVERYKE